MDQLIRWMEESNYTVVMTGAGMSTESGLPDFRSNKGLWRDKDPVKLASTEAMMNNRDDFISFYQSRMKALSEVEPNRGHQALADWERTGRIQSIITQNVDGLHQRAGSQTVAELHGGLATVRCHKCGFKESFTAFVRDDTSCKRCGGFLRPNVVLFGEMLPENAMRIAHQETAKSELFIVLGSSLAVAPASSFPAEAKQNGARLVIINQTSTELDGISDLIIQRSIGKTLQEINAQI